MYRKGKMYVRNSTAVFCGLFFYTSSVFAQTRTLDTVEKRLDRMDFGFYGAAVVKRSPFDGSYVTTPGLNVGITANHWLWLGMFGRLAAGDVNYRFPEQTSERKQKISANLYGFEAGANLWTDKLIHVHVAMSVGRASLVFTDQDSAALPADTNDRRKTSFNGYEPEMQLEVNLTDSFRAGVGLGYRIVRGGDKTIIGSEKLDGMTTSVSLKFVSM